VVLGLTLSALAMFTLVAGVSGSWGAGLAAGLMYAFNSFTRHELLRVHVLHVEWWPVALLALDRFVNGPAPQLPLTPATSVNIASADSVSPSTTHAFEASTALPVAQLTGATISASGSR